MIFNISNFETYFLFRLEVSVTIVLQMPFKNFKLVMNYSIIMRLDCNPRDYDNNYQYNITIFSFKTLYVFP